MPNHRRGYATEADARIVAWARRQPGVEAVVAGCERDNMPSMILERIGFTRAGEADSQTRWRYSRR